MRVLAATSSFPRFVGDYYGNFVYNLCCKLVQNGVDVTVMAPRSRSTAEALGALRVKRFPFMPSKKLETLPEQTLKDAPSMALIQLPSYLFSAYVHMLREATDIVHAHFAIPMGFLCALSHRRTPLVITCHGSDCTLPIAEPAYRPFVRCALRKADRVVAVSEYIRSLALKLGARSDQTEVIYTGVDVERFKPILDRKKLREELGLPTERIIIGTLGRLVPEKRIEDLVRAVACINRKIDAHFIVGGEGPQRPHLEGLSKQLGLDNVQFFGEVRDAVKFHQLCDVFVLTSIREGLSVSLQEAMATGSVAVTVNGFGCPEIVNDGENGFLFEPMNIRDLTNKILDAANSPHIGEKARTTVLERFDVERNALRYIEVYGSLISDEQGI